MNKHLTVLLATAAVALAGTAFAQDATYEANTKIKANTETGNYSKDTAASRKDDSGKVSTEVKTEANTTSSGAVNKTTTTEHVNDPKGLFNENKVKTKETVKTDKNGNTTHSFKKSVNGNTVENTTANTSTSY